MLKVVYRDWNLPYGRPAGPQYDETEAHRRMNASETFGLLVGDPEHPDVVLQVGAGGERVRVSWLDHLNREELSYYFNAVEDSSKLFMGLTRVKVYDSDSPPPVQPTFAEAWYFQPDGSYFAARMPAPGAREESRGILGADELQGLWEERPTLGVWQPLLRRDR